MKRVWLLALGVLLLASAIALAIFSDFDPARLFVGGGACTLIGLAHLLSRPYASGPASDLSDARNLARAQQFDASAGDAGSGFHGGP